MWSISFADSSLGLIQRLPALIFYILRARDVGRAAGVGCCSSSSSFERERCFSASPAIDLCFHFVSPSVGEVLEMGGSLNEAMGHVRGHEQSTARCLGG